jgi:hypothetical protein
MSFTGRKSFSRKSIDKPQPSSISTSHSVPAMPQPLSPASRFGFSNSASARNLSSHPLDSPVAGPVGRKKSLSPSTASTSHSGDSHGSSGKGGSSLPSIRSLGARFGFGKSPSGGKKSLPSGRANVNSQDAGLAAQQPPQASHIAMSPTSPRSPMPVPPASFSRLLLGPAPTPLPPHLAQHAMSEAQSTRHSVDAVPARSRTSSLADSLSRSSLNLPTRRDSSPGGSGSLLRAPLSSLNRSNSWIAPSLGRASRERIEEERESQVVNVSEIGEIAADGGAGGNGELVIDLTNSLTIRGPQRSQSRSRSNSTLDKPLPTPPMQEPTTLKPAIKLTPDVKPSSLPGSTAIGISTSHLAVSPSQSSFSATPIMNGSPLLPKGVLGELAKELKNVAESPSTRQLLRARASAVELSRPVSTVNPDGQGVNAQLGLMELKGAVERMRAMVEELEKGVTTGPVAFEIPTGNKKPEEKSKERETTVLDRSDSDLVAVLTPKLEGAEAPKVPPPPVPEPVSKQSLSTPSTPSRVHFLINVPTTAAEGPPTITRNSATSKAEMHDEHDDDPYEAFQPGAESSPATSRRNIYKHSMGSSIRTSTNARRTGRPSFDFPNDEEDAIVGKGLGRVPLSRGSASPAPSSYDGRQSPFRPGSAAPRVLGRNTVSSTSNARDRPPMPAWDGMRKYLPSETGTGADKRGSRANSPSPGSTPALSSSQFYHRRTSSTLARPTTTDSTRSPLSHSRNLRSVGSFDEPREWGSSKSVGGGIRNPTNVSGKRLSELSTGLGPRTARAFAAAGILPSNYKSPTSEKDFRTLERERATSSMSARRDPTGSGSDRLGTWSRLGFNRAREDIAHGHHSSPSGVTTGIALSDSTTTSSPASSGAPRAAVSSLSTVSSSNSGPSTTNVPMSNHQAIISSLKERHELETEALLNALSGAKKESKALREVNEELKGEVESLSKFIEELEERLADEVAKRKTVERQLEERKRSKERRVCETSIKSYAFLDHIS